MTLATLLAILKIILFDKISNIYKLLTITIILLLYAAGKNSYDFNLYYYAFFIFSARDIDFKLILRWFIALLVSLISITVLSAVLHLIPTLAIGRTNSSVLRLSLGSIYPSDFAARIFHLMVAYAALRKFNFNLAEIISFLAISVTTFVITDTKLDLILMLCLVISVVAFPTIKAVFSKVSPYIINLFVTLFIIFNLGLAYFYSSANPIFRKLDSLLTGRLSLGHIGFKDYNATLYGQFVYQNGWGGLHSAITNYFYIDSSLVRTLLMQGIIAYIFIIWLILRNVRKFSTNRQYSLLLALLFIVLSSAIDQHLIELSFNFIFLASFTNNNYFIEHKEQI
ncbi:polymerase [Ligilactobacillus salivarius]|nr:polymerase [Ligilactobacillus salivarius]UUV96211.1 polymerase [Ligilactobacillus salivarius]